MGTSCQTDLLCTVLCFRCLLCFFWCRGATLRSRGPEIPSKKDDSLQLGLQGTLGDTVDGMSIVQRMPGSPRGILEILAKWGFQLAANKFKKARQTKQTVLVHIFSVYVGCASGLHLTGSRFRMASRNLCLERTCVSGSNVGCLHKRSFQGEI